MRVACIAPTAREPPVERGFDSAQAVASTALSGRLVRAAKTGAPERAAQKGARERAVQRGVPERAVQCGEPERPIELVVAERAASVARIAQVVPVAPDWGSEHPGRGWGHAGCPVH